MKGAVKLHICVTAAKTAGSLGIGAINGIGNVMPVRFTLRIRSDEVPSSFPSKPSATNIQTVVTHPIVPQVELYRLYHNTELHSVRISSKFLCSICLFDLSFLEGFPRGSIPKELLIKLPTT